MTETKDSNPAVIPINAKLTNHKLQTALILYKLCTLDVEVGWIMAVEA